MQRLVKPLPLKAVAEFVGGRVIGDDDTPLSGISSIESATPGDLVFVEDAKNLQAALESRASAVIVPEGTVRPASKAILVAAQPRLAFARAAHLLCPAADRRHGIHPSAIVHSSAVLHENVTV